MTDRPIIFSGPMVRALLDGRKTQTRRLATSPLRRVVAGDRLYVRENWRVSPEACDGWHPEVMRGWIDYQAGGSLEVTAPSFLDVVRATFLKTEAQDWDFIPSRYRPCIHMPRWASRLTLIVEEVRFDRVNQISERDAYAEGLTRGCIRHDHCLHTDDRVICGTSGAAVFGGLWNSLHTKEGETWIDNPEIVALTFRVAVGNIEQIGRAA